MMAVSWIDYKVFFFFGSPLVPGFEKYTRMNHIPKGKESLCGISEISNYVNMEDHRWRVVIMTHPNGMAGCGGALQTHL